MRLTRKLTQRQSFVRQAGGARFRYDKVVDWHFFRLSIARSSGHDIGQSLVLPNRQIEKLKIVRSSKRARSNGAECFYESSG